MVHIGAKTFRVLSFPVLVRNLLIQIGKDSSHAWHLGILAFGVLFRQPLMPMLKAYSRCAYFVVKVFWFRDRKSVV